MNYLFRLSTPQIRSLEAWQKFYFQAWWRTRKIATHTGEEALEQAQRAIALEEPYAIAFVDQNLNGVDVAIRLKQLDSAIEIVIVTAYFDRQDKDCLHRTLGSGNFHVLHKPFKATAIKRLVESVRPFV